jgi:hypothetical protein
MRKDICVQHWAKSREAQYAIEFEYVRGLVVRVPTFI